MLTLFSPAKINLFLKVVGKRSDGYHDLQSLFQTVNLVDTLHFSLHGEDEITSTSRFIPTDNSNLILKAADLFRQKTGKDFGLHVHLVKRIPHRAGLGGGSGNAATTLYALNELTERPATIEQLALWSEELGSDIPFFFSSGTAYCTGRGEKVDSMKPLPGQKLWIVMPDKGLSTPEVFSRLMFDKLPTRDSKQVLEAILNGKMECFNDLEPAAIEALPLAGQIKKKLLDSGCSIVSLTGSGSAFITFTKPPKIPHARTFETTFTNRSANSWYLNPLLKY